MPSCSVGSSSGPVVQSWFQHAPQHNQRRIAGLVPQCRHCRLSSLAWERRTVAARIGDLHEVRGFAAAGLVVFMDPEHLLESVPRDAQEASNADDRQLAAPYGVISRRTSDAEQPSGLFDRIDGRLAHRST